MNDELRPEAFAWYWRERAEKAERERDEATELLRHMIHGLDAMGNIPTDLAMCAHADVMAARAFLARVEYQEPTDG